MAGWIDAVGIKLFAKEASSFMTGKGRILASLAFEGDLSTLFTIIIVVLSFIIGAFISTIVTKKFGLTGGLILTGTLIIIALLPIEMRNLDISLIAIPMGMGAQNAATSLTEINRTTHLTGAATDIGINLAKGNWKKSKFWILRWIGFFLGAYLGLVSASLVSKGILNKKLPLFFPAFIIIVTGIGQKLIFDIPLIEGEKIIEKKN